MLDIIHWNPPISIFNLGGFEIRYYSLLFGMGFLIGYLIVKRMFAREHMPEEWLDKLLFYIFIGAIVGARLGHCIFYDWDYYSQHILEIFLPVEFEPRFRITGFRGLASHGGAIGVIIALLLFNKRYSKKPWLWIFDRIVVPVALAGGFIRLGNLMNSEIIGKATDASWGFVFEQIDLIPRHPVQLYESICYFILFGILIWMYWRTAAPKYQGRIFAVFLILLWGIRFVLEYFKKSQGGIEYAFNGILSTGQLLSIPFIILGFVLLIINWNKKYPKNILEHLN